MSPVNERRQFISGFTGTSGTAVVTANKAVLWTDGRYYLQADQQLDCHWILMKSGQPQVPCVYIQMSLFSNMYKNDTHQQVLDVGRWLKSSLSSGDRVGADPKLVSANQWLDWRNELGEHYLPLFIAQLNTAKYPFFSS